MAGTISHGQILEWSVPFIMAALAVMFSLVRFRGIASLRLAYVFMAAACSVVLVPPASLGSFSLGKILVENAFFLGAGIAFAHFMARRYGRQPRYAVLLPFAALGLLFTVLAYTVWNSTVLEATGMTFACALILAEAAYGLRGRMARGIDRVLFAATLLFSLSLMVQAAFAIWTPDPALTAATWRQSEWGFAIQYLVTLFAVTLAFVLLLALGLELMDALRVNSDLDPLSGLLNRRGFACFHDESSLGDAGLVLADLDHFKTINDRYGHAAGDAAIAGFASLLSAMIPPEARAARLGGEEFAVLLPSSVDARGLAERFRVALKGVKWPAPLGGSGITASFGVVHLASGETLEQALERADALLYEAKRRGRDRVLGGQPPEERGFPPRLPPREDPDVAALAQGRTAAGER